MCSNTPTPSNTPIPMAMPNANGAERKSNSRRKRLWELDSHAYCPVVGVCLPLARLRKLAEKLKGVNTLSLSEYELHCLVVSACKQRTAIAESTQRELDERYALVLRQAQAHKSGESLALWWQESRTRDDWAGALWATLTHPRCDALLEQQVLGEVHMLQHQVGMATRADVRQLDALQQENAILARELAAAQSRSQQQTKQFTTRLEALQSEAMRSRAELVQTQTSAEQLRGDLERVHLQAPDLAPRINLAQRVQELEEALRAARRQLQNAQLEIDRQSRQTVALQERWDRTKTEAPELAAESSAPPAACLVSGQSVLCVGGRTASLPAYRAVVEHTGARFLHHDGGQEDSSSMLDATLAAADLVICQSGCISHNAYWRVKDHCKRTGKRCIFIETPSRSALERALSGLMPALTAEQETQTTTGSGSNMMPNRS
jgi:phage shock protein A